MQVLSIVTKLMKYTLTGKMENRKDWVSYTGLGLNSMSDNSKFCGKGGILGLYIEKEGRFLLLKVIVG